MNIAFGTVLIFLILTPGLLLQRSYYSYPFSKKFLSYKPLSDIGWSILPGTVLQVLFILYLQNFTNINVDFKIIGALLTEKYNPEVFGKIKANLFDIVKYNIVLWGIAIFLGHLGRIIVRITDLDKKVRFFRFNNEWHYILSGEILRFPYIMYKPIKKIDFKYLDVLINTGEGDYIYSGLLQDYTLSRDGKLESVCLSHVKRRKLQDDLKTSDVPASKADDRFYKLPGSLFIIPYNNISNINVRYVDIHVKVNKKNKK